MAKCIMVQGTASGAGKSLLVAALCRIFKQDGLKAAPFKSQNMALNSFITEEGLEMGRAQVMQAEAAMIKPSVLMNPILLKPTTDIGSQVIVNGKVLGTMKAVDYFKRKRSLIPDVLSAYAALAKQYDVIVIEGAGSPAEINLKTDDIVNMGLAELVDAPVILIGDIDKGGVFASLYGTVELVTPQERARIKGTVINKFRGDKSILEPGLRQLEDLTHIPVLGVVPYLPLALEDEDSLTDRFDQRKEKGVLDIAVIRLPRISNFTDFNPLEQISGVSLRYVSAARELGTPDCVILPGSKSTIADLLALRQNGIEAAIKKLAAQGVPIIGICGGYQMLGKRLADADGVEGEKGQTVAGMGLLPVETTFTAEKRRTRVDGKTRTFSGTFAPLSEKTFSGYEIHMGRTENAGGEIFSELFSFGKEGGSQPDGCVCENVFGSYVHGIFEKEEFTQGFLRCLLARCGLAEDALAPVDYDTFKQAEYDKLADCVRESLDMKEIYRIIGRGGLNDER